MDSYLQYTSIAFQMIAIILLGVFGGRKLDAHLENQFPVFTVVFSLLAIGIALYHAIRDMLKMK